jgi:hypothetical protein
MRYLKIGNPFKKLKLMFKEIDNYYFYIRQIEMFDDTGEMRHRKLKLNDKHEIYGAINMPVELLMYHKQEDLEQLEKTYFGNEMAQYNDVFLKYDIMELYKIEFERVKTEDYYAYVFNIRFNWNHCTRKNVITAIALTLGALGAIVAGVLYVV